MTSRALRLYAISRPEADIAAALTDAARAEALKVDLLGDAAADVEIFAVKDLDDLGLAGYLTSGHGIEDSAVAPLRPRLAALDGYVLILHGDAPETVNADLTLIADLTRPGTDWQPEQTLDTDSAKPGGGSPRKPKSDAAMMGRVAMVVLLVIFALTALMVWIAA